MLFMDTETIGLHGPIVLFQYAYDDGEICLYSPWKSPISETIELIEEFVEYDGGICLFNASFDWFHICQMYTTLLLMSNHRLDLEDCVDEYAIKEAEGRFGPCLKPKHVIDLYLHARKTEYQSTMDRGDVRIKRVPTALAWSLAEDLNKRIPLKDVYFARRKDPKKRWMVRDIHDDTNDVLPEFKDVVLSFSPSSALKALAGDALGVDVDEIKVFADVEVDRAFMPIEFGYAPFATAPFIEKASSGRKFTRQPSPNNWYGKWPQYIRQHYDHWAYNRQARKYATDDVVYTRGLYEYFGKPEVDDVDSVLACMVAAVRWRGYNVNVERLQNLKNSAEDRIDKAQYSFGSTQVCRKYLRQEMSETELLVMNVNGKMTTKGIVLEEIAKWKKDDVCNDCLGMGCDKCTDGLIATEEPHPAAVRAREILDYRHACKEVELYEKLILAGRFHASFNVIGALSSRMSGADGLNAQGIRRADETRECFPLADKGYILNGGDFKGQEVTIADAVYKDPRLHEMLQSGKKIHAIFGTYLFPHMTYEQILATKGLPNEEDRYTRSKNGVFAMLYGGESYTLQSRVGVSADVADQAYANFCRDFQKWGQERAKIFDMFCSMRQPNGIGSRVEWNDPPDYMESLFGFRRYFTLENTICKALFQLAENPPKEWQSMNFKVTRRDRQQTACGALRSALFAAAFAQQAANMRAAANHVIQSSGATLTKILEARIWELQPAGINNWRVQPMNIHDEILAPAVPSLTEKIQETVVSFIAEYKGTVPLLGIDWKTHLKTWANK